jgi:hypothetical protein
LILAYQLALKNEPIDFWHDCCKVACSCLNDLGIQQATFYRTVADWNMIYRKLECSLYPNAYVQCGKRPLLQLLLEKFPEAKEQILTVSAITNVRRRWSRGNEAKYRSWEEKTIALAGSKGFLLALTKIGVGRPLTVEEYENGEVEVPGMDVTGGAVTAATTRPTTAAENCKYTAKAAAWTHLVARCTDKAYALVGRCKGDPFNKAWSKPSGEVLCHCCGGKLPRAGSGI